MRIGRAKPPAGTYSWQVQLIDSSGIRIGRARQFTVSANATRFLVPDAAALLVRVTAEAHPRGLPDSTTLALMLGDRQSAVSALASAVNSLLSRALPGAPSGAAECLFRWTAKLGKWMEKLAFRPVFYEVLGIFVIPRWSGGL